MKVFFKVEDHYFDTETGKEVTSTEALKGLVLIFREEKTYVERRSKARYRYAYKTRDGTWILSNEFSTSFLGRVLEDFLGKNQIAVTAPALVLTFFGDRQDYLISTSLEEKQKFLEIFFQGVPFKEISLKDALSLVIKRNRKFLIFLALLPVALFPLLFWLSDSGNDETLRLKKFTVSQKMVKPVKPLSPKEISIRLTEGKIERLDEVLKNVKPWQYVARLDFSVGKAVVKSMKPDIGFVREGNWFKREVSLLKRSDVKPFKTFSWCYSKIQTLGGVIVKNLPDKVEFRLKKDTTNWKEISELLKIIYGCPADLRGTVWAEPLPTRVHMSISVTLFREVK